MKARHKAQVCKLQRRVRVPIYIAILGMCAILLGTSACASHPRANTSVTSEPLSGTATGGNHTNQACALITLDEATRSLGDTVTEALPGGGTRVKGAETCEFVAAHASNQLGIELDRNVTAAQFDAFNWAPVDLPESLFTPVSGLGDQAKEVIRTPIAVLAVRSGSSVVAITMVSAEASLSTSIRHLAIDALQSLSKGG